MEAIHHAMGSQCLCGGGFVGALLWLGLPYAIVYRSQVNYIQVMALAHSRRKPKYWQEHRWTWAS